MVGYTSEYLSLETIEVNGKNPGWKSAMKRMVPTGKDVLVHNTSSAEELMAAVLNAGFAHGTETVVGETK